MSIRNRARKGYDELNAPVPGYSLTLPKGQWDWDKPPRDSDPEIVVSKIVDKLEKPSVKKRLSRLMLSGATIQEITNTISLAGFAKGEFSVDTAELIKPAVVIYLTKLALDDGIPVKVFNSDDKSREADDNEMLDSMRTNNPKIFEAIREQVEFEKQNPKRDLKSIPMEEKGFIEIQPDEIIEKEI